MWVGLQHCDVFSYTVLLRADDRTTRKAKNDAVLNISLIKTLYHNTTLKVE